MFRAKFLIFLIIGSCQGLIDIDKHLKICDRNSLDVNECLVEAIRDGLPAMCDGIPDYGVPPIDPYHQKELRVNYNNFQVTAKMVMTNIFVVGLKDAKVKKARLRANDEDFHLEVDMFSPRISINGSYQGYGGFNSFKANSSGEFNCTMHELEYTWKLDGKTEQKENETYMRINNFYMRPDVRQMKSLLTSDQPENRDFMKFVNEFGNENWKPLYRELVPYAQENWKQIGIRVANKLFLKLPYRMLFPSN